MPSAKTQYTRDQEAQQLVDAPTSQVTDTVNQKANLPLALHRNRGLKRVVVPLMLLTSSVVMALAWLGHLRFTEWPFLQAMLACWLLVLPEYFLNISAVRLGYDVYSGAVMAAFNLCSGVVCVALVSSLVLGETLSTRQIVGFGLMIVAMGLISAQQRGRFIDEEFKSFDEKEAADMRRPSGPTDNGASRNGGAR